MLNNKFNYITIDRSTEEGKRLYCLPDGSKVPSVTTILDKTKPQEAKDSLLAWRKRVGEAKAKEITTEAAGRGTRMHKFLEDFIKTGTLTAPGSNPYSKESYRMAQHVIEHGLKNVTEGWGVEIPLYFPGLYAGTTDGCGIHLGDESILDYKQTNKPKKEEWIQDYFLQLVAYALAHNEIYGTNIKKGVVLMCVKPQTTEDQPRYQEFVLTPDKFDYWTQKWWDRVEAYYSNK